MMDSAFKMLDLVIEMFKMMNCFNQNPAAEVPGCTGITSSRIRSIRSTRISSEYVLRHIVQIDPKSGANSILNKNSKNANECMISIDRIDP